jgi:hypothetical protein
MDWGRSIFRAMGLLDYEHCVRHEREAGNYKQFCAPRRGRALEIGQLCFLATLVIRWP